MALFACKAIWRPGTALLAAAIALLTAAPIPARAFDFFGLFGSSDPKPPAPSAQALPYQVDFQVVGADKDLTQALRDASNLLRLQDDAPPDSEALVRRAEADLPRLIDALWGAGYYNARVVVTVAGVPLRLQSERTEAAVRAAAGYRARGLVPVQVLADPGTQFRLRDVTVVDAAGRPFTPAELPPRVVKVDPGDPARSADILAAQARIVDYFRAQSRPFAKVADLAPVVDHPSGAMDIRLAISPGPQAGIGPITVRGAENVDPAVIRSFIYTEPGDPYSPRALADIRKSVLKIEALSSARIREAEALDRYGNLPLDLEVTERKPRALSISAGYSTIDGPEVRGSWTHRNLFGGAERLRFEGSLFYLQEDPLAGVSGQGKSDFSDIGGRFSASFLKPALWGTRNDFLADAVVARERTEGYTSRFVNVTAGIRHRFSDTSNLQVGIEYEQGQSTDILGRIDYTLVGLPVAFTYDSTDNPLDPTRGVKFIGGITPYPEFFGSNPGMTVAKATASTYVALDEDARYILAGRIGFGSIVGADLDEIPANRRFFAGGGGSVRGYEYRTLGPSFLGVPIGGRSLLEGSIEARIKVTDTIGIVPFVDAGQAFASSFPDFDEPIRVAAGLGLRYYTGIGPIRLDVATPLNPERGDRPVSVYISIGQAF